MYAASYALSTLPADEALILDGFGEIEPDDPPADHSPADERWLATQHDDQDDHGVDLTPIDISVWAPSARYTEADGPIGSWFGHDA